MARQVNNSKIVLLPIQIIATSENFFSTRSAYTNLFHSFLLMQPMSMVLPGVVGFKLTGKLRDGVTATDLVLTVTQMLRKHGVVGKFVEFYGRASYSTCFGSSIMSLILTHI